MTNTEVSQKSVETEIENLKKGVEILDEKNTINKETKSRFLEYVDCYLNHILYSKNFFKESTNHSWKDKCEKIYEKIINLKK
ncbi:MAG: hypothetical protein LBC61_04950 [Candidatus Peribacteria bacterium]|jgi:hypothetical protein|nr:hypothetical protein [Candidatus Peribacteria bacterium]